MQAREGYCFTQVESAVLTILSLDHHFFKLEKAEYDRFSPHFFFEILIYLDLWKKKEFNINYEQLLIQF